MQQGIHPEYVPTEVVCSCGNTFVTRSTITSGHITADVCAKCHPFYTGSQFGADALAYDAREWVSGGDPSSVA